MKTRLSPGRHRAAATAGSSSSRHAARPRAGGRRGVLAAAVGATLVGGGAAIAAWTVSGEGPADAQAITADEVVIDDLATPTAQLYPGGTGDITFRVRNPLDYPVTLNTVQFGDVTPSGTCPVGSVVPVGGYTMAAPVVLAANQGFTEVTLADAVEMLNAVTTDACKGATFSIEVGLSGFSS